jgi:hypothetical protein
MNKLLFYVMTTLLTSGGYKNISAQPVDGLSLNRTMVYEKDVKILRHFKEIFPGISGEQWSVSGDGAMSRFESDGMVWRVFYTKKGKLWLTVKYYDEGKLSADIRAMVKSRFYDDRILTVEEIITADKTQYRIDMEGTRTRKTIGVFEGETYLLNEFDILP